MTLQELTDKINQYITNYTNNSIAPEAASVLFKTLKTNNITIESWNDLVNNLESLIEIVQNLDVLFSGIKDVLNSQTTYSAGTGLTLSGTTFSVNFSVTASRDWVTTQLASYVDATTVSSMIATSLQSYSTTTQMNTAIAAYHDNTKQNVLNSSSNISIASASVGESEATKTVIKSGRITQYGSGTSYDISLPSTAGTLALLSNIITYTAGNGISISNNVISTPISYEDYTIA